MNKDNQLQEIKTYIEPDKPLTYNFFEVTTLQQLIDKDPTSGKRKEKVNADANEDKPEQKQENKLQINNQEEEQMNIKKPKIETNEIFEGKITDLLVDTSKGGQKFQESKFKSSMKNNEIKKEEQKKLKIKYKKYTNAFNVSNNKITSLRGIDDVLRALLPELPFSSSLSKVDLLQWIDISRNKLVDIHPDICKLRYLKILYVHGNNIQEIEKVTALAGCKSLTSLTLYGNPIDHIKGYRHFIIEMCPVLEKLDSAVISEKELDIIKFGGSHYGEIRDKHKKVVRYPKLPDEIIQTLKMAEQNAAEKKDDS